MANFCSNCGSAVEETDKFCPNCGVKIETTRYQYAYEEQSQPTYQQEETDSSSYAEMQYNEYYSRPARSKVVAGVLAILVGGLGVHEFYLNRVTQGILMLVFCWTGIPEIIALIQGILILVKSDEEFEEKYHVRTLK